MQYNNEHYKQTGPHAGQMLRGTLNAAPVAMRPLNNVPNPRIHLKICLYNDFHYNHHPTRCQNEAPRRPNYGSNMHHHVCPLALIANHQRHWETWTPRTQHVPWHGTLAYTRGPASQGLWHTKTRYASWRTHVGDESLLRAKLRPHSRTQNLSRGKRCHPYPTLGGMSRGVANTRPQPPPTSILAHGVARMCFRTYTHTTLSCLEAKTGVLGEPQPTICAPKLHVVPPSLSILGSPPYMLMSVGVHRGGGCVLGANIVKKSTKNRKVPKPERSHEGNTTAHPICASKK